MGLLVHGSSFRSFFVGATSRVEEVFCVNLYTGWNSKFEPICVCLGGELVAANVGLTEWLTD